MKLNKLFNGKTAFVATLSTAAIIGLSAAAFAGLNQEHRNHGADAGTSGHHEMVNRHDSAAKTTGVNHMSAEGTNHAIHDGNTNAHSKDETHILGHDKDKGHDKNKNHNTTAHSGDHGTHDQVNQQVN